MQDDKLVMKVHKSMNGKMEENFMITQDGMIVMRSKICMADVDDLRKAIMEEAYCSTYAMHPGSTKMYRNIKKNYWRLGMKRDIVEFVSKCLVCQQVKMKH